jgi:hypothetical protein
MTDKILGFINVSLTYLRGLEIPELTEEDIPVV